MVLDLAQLAACWSQLAVVHEGQTAHKLAVPGEQLVPEPVELLAAPVHYVSVPVVAILAPSSANLL